MAGKLKIVISDLHLDAGHTEPAQAVDRFAADTDFARLLDEIRAESDQTGLDVELILNGDVFEFLQAPAVADYRPEAGYPQIVYRDSSAKASLKRLNLIRQSHPQVFSALARFMRVEEPVRRITIIKGNHDIHLYWPEVKAKLREILGATGVRSSRLLFAQEFINREGIYVEHGHQHSEKMNAYPNFNTPVDKDNPSQLYYPPGSRLLVDHFQELKAHAWWIDNVKPFTCLIWYALKWDFDFAAQLLSRLIRNTPTLFSDPATTGSLNRLVEQLEDADQRRSLAASYAASEAGRLALHHSIQSLVIDAAGPAQSTPAGRPAIKADPLEMARFEQQAAQNALRHRAAELAAQEKAHVFIFGHTHRAAFERLDHQAYFINTGCWLWNQYLNEADPQIWRQRFNQPDPTQYRPRLPYARIDYDDAGRPHPQLLDFSGQGFSWLTPPAESAEQHPQAKEERTL